MSTPPREFRAGASSKRTVVLAMVALVGASGVLGSLFYKQGQARRGNYAIAEQVVPDMAPALQDARLSKAKVLREKWKGWALEHKDILKKMLNGSQVDQAVVWQALPLLSSETNMGDVNNGLALYTWNPARKGLALPNAVMPADLKAKEKVLSKKYLDEYFEKYQDIQVCMSRNAGAKTIGLWASGRVTETTFVSVPYDPDEPGKPSYKHVERELVPPYDFLTE